MIFLVVGRTWSTKDTEMSVYDGPLAATTAHQAPPTGVARAAESTAN